MLTVENLTQGVETALSPRLVISSFAHVFSDCVHLKKARSLFFYICQSELEKRGLKPARVLGVYLQQRLFVSQRNDFFLLPLPVCKISKTETGVPHLSPSIKRGLACGTDNQVSVAVCPRLLVLVNAISALTHKAFVFHHAAASAHPLCQPASLSPGIIYPRSTEHTGHLLSSLMLSLLPLSFPRPWYHSVSRPITSASVLSAVM